MVLSISRNEAVELLKKYNKDAFHLHHAYTVEAVMRYFAEKLGYGEDADFWATVGLLHDIDFEKYPEEHCKKAPSFCARAAQTRSLSTRYARTATVSA